MGLRRFQRANAGEHGNWGDRPGGQVRERGALPGPSIKRCARSRHRGAKQVPAVAEMREIFPHRFFLDPKS
jgi:hypothetical protein